MPEHVIKMLADIKKKQQAEGGKVEDRAQRRRVRHSGAGERQEENEGQPRRRRQGTSEDDRAALSRGHTPEQVRGAAKDVPGSNYSR